MVTLETFRRPRERQRSALPPLTLSDNDIRLGTDPLDFGALRQVVAIGVVAGPAFVRARVFNHQVSDGDSAGGVVLVSCADLDPVLPGAIPQLYGSFIGISSFKPPLDFGDGVANSLTVQFHAFLCQFLLRER